jgi:hypothetical protein
MTAIGNDAAIDEFSSDPESGFDAFLKRLQPPDAEKPSGEEGKTKEQAAPEEKDETETPAEEGDESSAEKPEAEADEGEVGDQEETKYADEGAYVKIKVGDEEHEVPVKDLSRLYGQEKSLTQKSMEVAEQRKSVDAEMAKNVAASAALLERAKARLAPYEKIDFHLAAKELSAEEYTQLRDAAKSAWEDVQFLQNNLNGFMQEAQARQHNALIEQAKECLKTLSGPVEQGGIEGWNEQLYDEVRAFGEKCGLRPEILQNLVDPAAYRLLHSAMLYERGKSKVQTVRVNKTPKKIIKTSQSPSSTAPDKAKADAAKAKLQKTGSTDDAAALFMARWADRDAEAA